MEACLLLGEEATPEERRRPAAWQGVAWHGMAWLAGWLWAGDGESETLPSHTTHHLTDPVRVDPSGNVVCCPREPHRHATKNVEKRGRAWFLLYWVRAIMLTGMQPTSRPFSQGPVTVSYCVAWDGLGLDWVGLAWMPARRGVFILGTMT